MGKYTEEILEKIAKKSEISREKYPGEYGLIVSYLENLDEDFLIENEDLYEEVTNHLAKYVVGISGKNRRNKLLEALENSLLKAEQDLKNANDKFEEERAKTGILFNRNPPEYQDAVANKKKAEKAVSQIQEKIKKNRSKAATGEESIDETMRTLTEFRDNLALAKKYFNENFQFCDHKYFEKNRFGTTKDEVESFVIKKYMEMLKAGFKDPSDKAGWVVGNEHGKAISELRSDLSEPIIDAMHKEVQKASDKDVNNYLEKISNGDEKLLKNISANSDFINNIKEKIYLERLIEFYKMNDIIKYNQSYCDNKRKEIENQKERLDIEINSVVNKYADHKKITDDAETYFKANFSRLLLNEDPSFKDSIINKYIAMRMAGFGKPEDNNGIHANITRMLGFGRNIIGEQILAEKSELSNVAVEVKVREHIKHELSGNVKRNEEDKKILNELRGMGFEEQVSLAIRKEAYEIPSTISLSDISESYCKKRSSEIPYSVKNLIDFHREAIEYFDKNFKSPFLDSPVDENSEIFVQARADIVKKYIKVRCDGYQADEVDYFKPDVDREKIAKLYLEMYRENSRLRNEFESRKENKGMRYRSRFDNMGVYDRFDYIYRTLKEGDIIVRNVLKKEGKSDYDISIFMKENTSECDNILLKECRNNMILVRAFVTQKEEELYRKHYLSGDTKYKIWEKEAAEGYNPIVAKYAQGHRIAKDSIGWVGFARWLLELLNPYANQIEWLEKRIGVNGVQFLVDRMVQPFYLSILAPFQSVANKDISTFEKILNLMSTALYERYEKMRYGHINHEQFLVKGKLKEVLDKNGNGYPSKIKGFSKKIAKELDSCADDIKKLEKQIKDHAQFGWEEKQKKLLELGRKLVSADASGQGEQTLNAPTSSGWIALAIFYGKAWISRGVALASTFGTNPVLGVSDAVQKSRDELKGLEAELRTLEIRQEILKNAWEKIKDPGKAKNDEEWIATIDNVMNHMNTYIEDIHLQKFHHESIKAPVGISAQAIKASKRVEYEPKAKSEPEPKPKKIDKGPKIVRIKSDDKKLEDANRLLDDMESGLIKKMKPVIPSGGPSSGNAKAGPNSPDLERSAGSKKRKHP